MLESVIQIKIKMTRTKEYFQFVPNCFLYSLIELNFARWEIENSGCSQPWKSGGGGGCLGENVTVDDVIKWFQR